MSEGSSPEKLTKLPVSNYDIVVYFGLGVCSLPLVYRYFLKSSNARFPTIFSGYSDQTVNTTVSITALIVSVYVIGHGIAIISSIFIEQFLYRTAGPPSSVIVNAAKPTPDKPSAAFRSYLRNRIKYSYWDDLHWADVFRAIVHTPIIPLYLGMYTLRFYGFYETKLNTFIILRVQKRLEHRFDFSDSIFSNVRWFKIVEYSCANDHPVATSKMYNYMVIYGLFRSSCMLILSAIWMEWLYFFCNGGIGFVDQDGHGNIYFRMIVLYGAYLVSFIGFGKFSRRYTEEAVQAFALSEVFEKPTKGRNPR
jgi:hypothetical protein